MKRVLGTILAASLLFTNMPVSVYAESREIAAGFNQTGFINALTEPSQKLELSNSALTVKGTLTANGDLYLEGDNSFGQLGTGDKKVYTGKYKTLTEVRNFSCGSNFVIAIKDDGSLWGWGCNDSNQLLCASVSVLSPVKICDGNFKLISCGSSTVLGITEDGDLFEWGDGASMMARVGSDFAWASAGASHCAAVKSDGSLWTWGSNAYGQLCDAGPSRSVPAKVGDNFEKVACGDGYTVALTSQKIAWGAGLNTSGQLGSSTLTGFHKLSSELFYDVAAGSTCTILQGVDGSVTVWGVGSEEGSTVPHNSYTIRFIGGEGSTGEMSPVTAKLGRTLVLPKSTFRKPGYHFKGWSTTKGGSVEFLDGASIKDLLTKPSFQDEILYAVWEPNRITLATDCGEDVSFVFGNKPTSVTIPEKSATVTLDSTGGSAVANSVEVPLIFQGYYDDAGNEVFNQEGVYVGDCTESTELTAKWKASVTELPHPTKPGYTFAGWSATKLAVSGMTSYNKTTDAKLYAVWVEDGKVVYNYTQNGGFQATKESGNLAAGNAIDLTVQAMKMGWEFVGWNTDPNATTALTELTMGTKSVVLYAIYSKTVSVEFVGLAGSETIQLQYYNNDSECRVELPTLTRAGTMEPLGWVRNSVAGEYYKEYVTIGLDSETFHAAYGKDVTVSFRSGEGGSYVNKVIGTVISVAGEEPVPAEITLPADVQSVDGYEFKGWSLSGASDDIVLDRIQVTEDANAYAVYEKEVALEYDVGDGSAIMPEVGTILLCHGNRVYPKIILPTPDREGFDFVNWTVDGVAVGDNFVWSRDCTATAQWKAHSYTVVFSGNGAKDGAMSSFTAKCGEEFKLPKNKFSTSYTVSLDANGGTVVSKSLTAATSFKGWSTTPGGDVKWLDEEVVSDLATEDGGSITLYAVFGDATCNLPTPVYSGYTFAGWYQEEKLCSSTLTVSKDTSLKAQWVANDLAVTVILNDLENEVVEAVPGKKLATLSGATMEYKVILNYNGLAENETVTVAYKFGGAFSQRNGAGVKYYDENFNGCRDWDREFGGTLYAYWIPVSIKLPEVMFDGYDVLGWYYNGVKVSGSFTPTKDCELVLRDSKASFKIALDAKGGTLLNDLTSYVFGSTVTLPKAWKRGFMFQGWVDSEGNTVEKITETDFGDKYYYAKWSRSAQELTALENKESIITYSVPEGIETIPDEFFAGCINLESVTLPIGLLSIGDGAFSNCSKLKTISIPSTVTKFGESIFHGSGLVEVNWYANSMNAEWLDKCPNLKTVIFFDPNCKFVDYSLDPMVTVQGYAQSTSREFAEKWELPFKSLGTSYRMTIDDGFGGLDYRYVVKNGSMPSTISVITWFGNGGKNITFGGYTLANKTIVASLGTQIYGKTGNLLWSQGYTFNQDITIKAQWSASGSSGNTTKVTPVTTFVKNKVAYKVKRKTATVTTATGKKVIIPATVIHNKTTYKVKYVSNSAFRGNLKLKKIVLGKNVVKVGKYAFKDCRNLKTITVKSGKVKVGKGSLSGTKAVKIIGKKAVKKAFQ